MNTQIINKDESLKLLGLENLGRTHWNLSTPELYEEAIRRHEGVLSHMGPAGGANGAFTTGRLPNDKFHRPGAVE